MILTSIKATFNERYNITLSTKKHFQWFFCLLVSAISKYKRKCNLIALLIIDWHLLTCNCCALLHCFIAFSFLQCCTFPQKPRKWNEYLPCQRTCLYYWPISHIYRLITFLLACQKYLFVLFYFTLNAISKSFLFHACAEKIRTMKCDPSVCLLLSLTTVNSKNVIKVDFDHEKGEER